MTRLIVIFVRLNRGIQRFFLFLMFCCAFACANIRIRVLCACTRFLDTKGDKEKRLFLTLIDNISDIPSRLIKRKKKKKCQATLGRTKSPINFVRDIWTQGNAEKRNNQVNMEKKNINRDKDRNSSRKRKKKKKKKDDRPADRIILDIFLGKSY